ncbi:DUF4956 domain-containing protein [Geofilum sp. OHC36d9]|uniref:DUF4956 domain-containing protein n=1 Tax=Geofilum sp. OHC36d9 TaxID=3458413 RepID=UPI004033E675
MTNLFLAKVQEPIDMWSFDTGSVGLMLFRFGVNLLVTAGIIRFLYYPRSQRRDYFFSFIITSTTIFMLLFMLDNVKIQVGFALGLFAIFGILRYRTDTLPIREMTYLFMIIGISVINALEKHVSYPDLFATNFIFIGVTWLMESSKVLRHVTSKLIVYEKIDLVRPDRYPELLDDLRERTGIPINKAEVGGIDFLKDTAVIKVYYNSKEVNSTDINFLKSPHNDF